MGNISISIWWYRELEQKYEGVGQYRHPTRIGPKYSTAITDKLFFDIDCMRQDGSLIYENIDGAKTLWAWARDNSYEREIAFTGGGYQMLIGAQVKAHNYSNAVLGVAQDLGIQIDENISLTDMRRVVGSFNFGKKGYVDENGERKGYKSARNTYCVSIQDHQMEWPWYKHLQLSFKQNVKIYKYGSVKYQPSRSKTTLKRRELDHRTDFTLDDTVDSMLDSYGMEYNDICPSMRAIIEKKHVGNKERIYVIKYLKDIVGMKYADVIMLLPKLLTAPHGNSNDGAHSIEEGQPKAVYSRGLVFQPKKMQQDGYCDPECCVCHEIMEAMKKI